MYTPEMIEMAARPEIQKRRGEWQKYDKWVCNHITIYTGEVEWISEPGHWRPHCAESIWLPPVYDEEKPERCLWNIFKWEWVWTTIAPDGENWGLSFWKDGKKDKLISISGKTPTEALLKAIVAQEVEK